MIPIPTMAFPDPRPLRILVIRNRYIGDTMLAVPALRSLRAAFPQARIDVLVEPISGDVLGPCPFKDELIYWQPRRRGGAAARAGTHVGLLAPARFLRARKYDRCYILRRSFSSALLALLARIPHRVGFSTEGRRLLLSRSTPYPTDKHEVECFLDILRVDGVPIADTGNEGWSDAATDEIVRQNLPANGRRRVFLGAKSSNNFKDWRPERFAAIAAWLIRERDCEIHLCDAPGNIAYYESIRDQLPPEARAHWHDWSHRLNLRGTLSLLRFMQLHVGVDTGLTHMSAAFNVPIVVLIEPVLIVRWRPWATRHELVIATPQPGASSFDRIQVADVQAAINRLLPSEAPRP